MAYATVKFCGVGGSLALNWGVIGAVGEEVSDLDPGFVVQNEVAIYEYVKAGGEDVSCFFNVYTFDLH